MSRALLPMLALLASCSPYRNVCGDLREGLARCGFELARLDCSKIAYSDVELLTEKLEARGCAGFATDGDAVDPRVCTLGNWSCPTSSVPAVDKVAPAYPMVFVSGIDGNAALDWNARILQALDTEPAVRASRVKVLPWATTAERAADLWASLQSLAPHLGSSRLNLVCYAVGGLDCRYLVSPNGLFAHDAKGLARAQALVASITTIATPHRGTRVAEASIDALHSGTASELIASWLGSSVSTDIPDDATLLRALRGLTLDGVTAFNTTITDAPGIPYFSWAGVSSVLGRGTASTDAAIAKHCVRADGSVYVMRHPGTYDGLNPVLWVTAPFAGTTRAEGVDVTSPSDGMISVESAKWGEFQGCIPADHYDVIGQIGHLTRDPQTGFDAPEFYRLLATQLAGRGL